MNCIYEYLIQKYRLYLWVSCIEIWIVFMSILYTNMDIFMSILYRNMDYIYEYFINRNMDYIYEYFV